MRINIKTETPIKDKEIKALYLVNAALLMCSERMIIPTLRFFADRYGYQLIRKGYTLW